MRANSLISNETPGNGSRSPVGAFRILAGRVAAYGPVTRRSGARKGVCGRFRGVGA